MTRRRCQILIDHATWDRLKAEAARRGLSVSALVRERLNGARAVGERPGALRDHTPADSLPDVSAVDQTDKKPILLCEF